ncbi:MAG: DUF167 domain-containing protein [Polyangiales bacterium]
MSLSITERPGGVLVDVHVVPRASRSKVVGVHDGCLKIALDAPPVDGAANEALVALLAKLLKRPRSAITLVRGHTSRRKTLAIDGVDARGVAALVPV